MRSRVLKSYPSPIDALFERVAYGWWQRLGRNRLRVMEAAAEAKRQRKEQSGDKELRCVHDKIPVFGPGAC